MRYLRHIVLLISVAVLSECTIARHALMERDSNLSSSVAPTSTAAYKPTDAPTFQLSSDEEFAFYLSEVLSLSDGGGANTGEVLQIAKNVIPHDIESTYTSFNYMAEQIHKMADSVDVARDPVSARDAYFRAATYYRGADFFLIGNWSDPRNYDLWDKALDCFNKGMALLKPVAGERFTVKAHSPNVGDFEAIGIFYKAAADNTPRPTILLGSGYDGSQEELYHAFIRGILARGLNAVSYEGPGQPTVRRQQNLGFIPDWWNVVTPVVDYLAERQDVDMSRLALTGVSFGGSLAPIAASREHRFSAVFAIDGLPNIRDAISASLPKPILDLYASGNKTAFDDVLHAIAANSSQPSEFRWLIDQSLWAFHTHSPYDWWTQLGNIKWTNETVKNLPMPVFVAKSQDDILTGNQANIANQMLTTGRPNGTELTYFHEFKTALGAGEHCAVGAEAQQAQVTLDWLSGIWDGLAYENHMD